MSQKEKKLLEMKGGKKETIWTVCVVLAVGIFECATEES